MSSLKNNRPILFIKPVQDHIQLHSIYSQLRFNILFDRFIINRLNVLFKNNGKVTDFIKEERRKRELDEIYTTIESSVYGTNKMNTTLQIMIKKHGKDFIHLSIHLAPEFLGIGKKDSGMIHIVKDIYSSIVSRKKDHLIHAIYSIEKVPDMHHSLHFSIQYRYSTPYNNELVYQYDDEIKKEMDVITTVLNQLFDENDSEHYVGYSDNTPLEQNTNDILRNMNTRTTYIKRKNVCKYLLSQGGRRKIRKQSKQTRRK